MSADGIRSAWLDIPFTPINKEEPSVTESSFFFGLKTNNRDITKYGNICFIIL